jgi:hypothetical protein
MVIKKIQFSGLLANVDKSILKVELEHGLKIEAMPEKDAVDLISLLEKLPPLAVVEKLSMDFPCLNIHEHKVYFISGSIESDIELDERNIITEIGPEPFDFHKKLVQGYLNPVTRLMRLFQEGNVYIPLSYYYFDNDGTPLSPMRYGRNMFLSRVNYKIKDSDLSNLRSFIQETKLPFKEPFLELAFENFEESHHTQNLNLQFLSLMIALESLFNPGSGEISYRIRRNCAVLLGKDKKTSENIFSEVKELYNKRSHLIHSGKSKIVKPEDIKKARLFVRESIKEIYKMNINKEKLLESLNMTGFGEGPRSK